ncbi:MAG TPA: hypothetical protein PKA27_08620 [Fimbriimonadaceae bacterium]|nr:hypothetical protein [Fimbriimonadaceae bacterium]
MLLISWNDIVECAQNQMPLIGILGLLVVAAYITDLWFSVRAPHR